MIRINAKLVGVCDFTEMVTVDDSFISPYTTNSNIYRRVIKGISVSGQQPQPIIYVLVIS